VEILYGRCGQGHLGYTANTFLLPLLQALHRYLSFACICFRSITEDTRKSVFISLLLLSSSHLNGDTQILVEEEIEGNRLCAGGCNEFVLKRGEKHICIVESRKTIFFREKHRV
jgi:hypothetical protein